MRLAKIKRIAQKSWMLQPLRPDIQVSGKQAKRLSNNVYKRIEDYEA